MLLSESLRYQLYDCGKDRVYLQNELTYLENYLALEQMRRVGADIDLVVNGNPNGIMIAPFLFIPFIQLIFWCYQVVLLLCSMCKTQHENNAT